MEGFVMLKQYKIAAIGMVCTLAFTTGQLVVSQEISKKAKLNYTDVKMFDTVEETTTDEVLLERTAVERQIVSISEVSTDSEIEVKTEIKETEELFTEIQEEAETEVLLGAEEVSELDGFVVPTVEEYLNIRSIPSTDGEIVGKLYAGTVAEILEEEADWYKIHSGSVEGYVYKPYTVTGKEAEAAAFEHGYVICKVLTGGLRVRENPGTDADVLDIVGEGYEFPIVDIVDNWVAIDFKGDTAYLSADYVKVAYDLGEAVSIEEERAVIRAAEEAAARQEKERQEAAATVVSKSRVMETVQRDGITTSDEDIYLLACLVHMEAAWEPYEGQLAVANIVLNRLKAGYGSSISEVIYARGQFSGANSGALAGVLAQGPRDTCITAAVEALSGVNNIGDYRNFIAASRASYGSYSEYTVVGNHCFYKN